jgi:glyoxylate reductase
LTGRPAVLITRRLPSSSLTKLQQVAAVDLYADEAPIPVDALRARVAGKDALVSMFTDRVDRDIIDAAGSLRIVANVAVGFNNIDVAYARSRGIVVTNTPDVLSDATADLTWALILAITRRLAEGDRLVRRGAWTGWAFDFMLGSDIRRKQLGVVGLGRIGRSVAARARAFGMHVAYAWREGSPPGPEDCEPMSFDRLLTTSDVVTLHVPLTPGTQHLIDRAALARMKRSAYLINTARGAVVDEAALVWALKERLIAGAALDVYEHEPAVKAELLTLDNVLLSPHLGSATVETRTAMADLAVENVLAVLAGRSALTPVTT